MKSTDPLHQLIQSLSRSEKRYFKIHSNRHVIGEENNYVKLFDLLDEMTEFDGDLLKAKLDAAAIKGNISSQKAYLYKLILKAMRAFHAESNGIFAAKELLLDAEFLFQKGQYSASKALLKKAQSDPSMQSSPLVQLEVLEKESDLLMLLEKDGLPELLAQIQETRDLWLNRLVAEEKLTSAYWAAFALHRKYGNLAQEPQKSLVAPYWLVLDSISSDHGLTPLARIRYRYLHWLKAQAKGTQPEILAASDTLLATWEEEPLLRKEYPTRYRMALANHLATLFRVERFADFPLVLEKLKSTPATNLDDEGEVFQNVALYELLFYLNSGNLAKAETLVPEIEAGLQKFDHKINKSRELTFRFNITVLYFFRSRWSESLRWVNSILNDRPSGHRKDVQDIARVFELILHFELGHHDLVEHKIRSVIRYFKTPTQVGQFARNIAAFLRDCLKAPAPREVLRGDSELYRTLAAEAHSSTVPGWLETTLWLRSHREALPLETVLKQHIQEK